MSPIKDTTRHIHLSGILNPIGSFHENVTLINGQNEIAFERLWYPLSILLLAAIGAKLIGQPGSAVTTVASRSINKRLLK